MVLTCTYEKNGSVCGQSTTAGKSLCRKCYNAQSRKSIKN